MCELMTIGAALFFTVFYFKVLRTPAVFSTMLMFWGAALMWSVDCVHSVMDGDELFDLSVEDMYLGFIVLAFGLAFFGVMLCIERLSIERQRTAAAAA